MNNTPIIKKFVLLILFFTGSITYAQQLLDNTKISNSSSESHIAVKGTKVSLVPPDGFTQAINFNGFQQDGSSLSIMVVEIPGRYNEISPAQTNHQVRHPDLNGFD